MACIHPRVWLRVSPCRGRLCAAAKDLGKKVARNEFPHAGPKDVDLFATATQRPRKAFHVCKGIIAPPPLFVKPFFGGMSTGGERMRAATLGVYPHRARRRCVPRPVYALRATPRQAYRTWLPPTAWEKVNAAGRLKIWRAPRAGTRVLSGLAPLGALY